MFLNPLKYSINLKLILVYYFILTVLLSIRDIYPSGTLNFSRIKNTDIIFNIEDRSSEADDNDTLDTVFPDYQDDRFILTPFTVSYNILSIKDGLTGLEFI